MFINIIGSLLKTIALVVTCIVWECIVVTVLILGLSALTALGLAWFPYALYYAWKNRSAGYWSRLNKIYDPSILYSFVTSMWILMFDCVFEYYAELDKQVA